MTDVAGSARPGGTEMGGTNPLWAIGPLDGRYAAKLGDLAPLVSEGALISFRIRVEAAWLLHLADVPEIRGDIALPEAARARLMELEREVPSSASEKVKEIEAVTNHDVKAVEYFLQEDLRAVGAGEQTLAFIHFACTSEDINNLSYALMLEALRQQVVGPEMRKLVEDLAKRSEKYGSLPMLSRTHGQTASPTTLGKELAVFAHRFRKQYKRLLSIPLDGKMSGAVGNYNAHLAAYPDLPWTEIARSFVEGRLGLQWNPLTTQIENHDSVVEYADAMRRFNSIGIDFARDIWGYVSLGYFVQAPRPGEVGSSTMPHKVNPIDFENAEGNFGLSSSIAAHFADKLLISRWQRDLSDSTVLRSIGMLAGYHVLALRSLGKGLDKLKCGEARLAEDLDGAWEVLAEAVQTVMRRYGVSDAYERLKAATRGKAVTREVITTLVEDCEALPDAEKSRLLDLTPAQYIGLAPELAGEVLKQSLVD